MAFLKFEQGDKVKVVENIYSIEGTLYKDTVVEIEEIQSSDKNLMVTDDVGRVWYLNFNLVKKING